MLGVRWRLTATLLLQHRALSDHATSVGWNLVSSGSSFPLWDGAGQKSTGSVSATAVLRLKITTKKKGGRGAHSGHFIPAYKHCSSQKNSSSSESMSSQSILHSKRRKKTQFLKPRAKASKLPGRYFYNRYQRASFMNWELIRGSRSWKKTCFAPKILLPAGGSTTSLIRDFQGELCRTRKEQKWGLTCLSALFSVWHQKKCICLTNSTFTHPHLMACSICPWLNQQKVFRVCLILSGQMECISLEMDY